MCHEVKWFFSLTFWQGRQGDRGEPGYPGISGLQGSQVAERKAVILHDIYGESILLGSIFLFNILFTPISNILSEILPWHILFLTLLKSMGQILLSLSMSVVPIETSGGEWITEIIFLVNVATFPAYGISSARWQFSQNAFSIMA